MAHSVVPLHVKNPVCITVSAIYRAQRANTALCPSERSRSIHTDSTRRMLPTVHIKLSGPSRQIFTAAPNCPYHRPDRRPHMQQDVSISTSMPHLPCRCQCLPQGRAYLACSMTNMPVSCPGTSRGRCLRFPTAPPVERCRRPIRKAWRRPQLPVAGRRAPRTPTDSAN